MRVFAPTITSFMHVILSSKIRRTCYSICTTIAPIMILASYTYLRDFSHIKTRRNCYLCLLAVSRIKKYMSGYIQPKLFFYFFVFLIYIIYHRMLPEGRINHVMDVQSTMTYTFSCGHCLYFVIEYYHLNIQMVLSGEVK